MNYTGISSLSTNSSTRPLSFSSLSLTSSSPTQTAAQSTFGAVALPSSSSGVGQKVSLLGMNKEKLSAAILSSLPQLDTAALSTVIKAAQAEMKAREKVAELRDILEGKKWGQFAGFTEQFSLLQNEERTSILNELRPAIMKAMGEAVSESLIIPHVGLPFFNGIKNILGKSELFYFFLNNLVGDYKKLSPNQHYNIDAIKTMLSSDEPEEDMRLIDARSLVLAKACDRSFEEFSELSLTGPVYFLSDVNNHGDSISNETYARLRDRYIARFHEVCRAKGAIDVGPILQKTPKRIPQDSVNVFAPLLAGANIQNEVKSLIKSHLLQCPASNTRRQLAGY